MEKRRKRWANLTPEEYERHQERLAHARYTPIEELEKEHEEELKKLREKLATLAALRDNSEQKQSEEQNKPDSQI